MLSCFTDQSSKKNIPIIFIASKDFSKWQAKQTNFTKNFLETSNFKADSGGTCVIPDAMGKISQVLCCITDIKNFWNAGQLPLTLPEGQYRFDVSLLPSDAATYSDFAIAWGLGAYQFSRYKKPAKKAAQLVIDKSSDTNHISNVVESIYLVRDLINTPTDDMGPSELAAETVKLAKTFKANVKQIIGDSLLSHHFATIHTVGRASDDAPRLIDLRWGNKKNPKITLIGKGVCFDSGGLDIKNAAGMLLMKKDMGGAAHVLGLARMIMQAKLPVNLRVLIPAVENAISGNAYRPLDVIKSHKGITIEIGNTDAEGRLVLADALSEACNDKPELIIDIATLTGAARIALGTELPAMFANNDAIAQELIQHGNDTMDPVWRLPLFTAYREMLNSPIADINNAGADSYAGAITAALFLKEFVSDDIPWVHFDLMAWNLKTKPGRPQGGEAMALRAIFRYLQKKYKN